MARDKNLKLDEQAKLLILNTITHGEITEIATLAKIVGVTEDCFYKALKRDKKFSKVFYNAREVYKQKKLAQYNDALDKIALGLELKTITEYVDENENIKGKTIVKKEVAPSFDALRYKIEKFENETQVLSEDEKIEIVLDDNDTNEKE